MALPWECPDCNARNSGRTSSCSGCGYERASLPSNGARTATINTTCSWRTDNRMCLMAGAIGTASPRCTFHSFAADHPRLRDDFEEFERWIAYLHSMHYCADWTHVSANDLWAAVRGERPIEIRHACSQDGCPYRVAERVA